MIDIFNMPKRNPDDEARFAAEDAAIIAAAEASGGDGLEIDEELAGRVQDLVGILAPNGSDDPEAVQGIIAAILAKDDEVAARGMGFPPVKTAAEAPVTRATGGG